MSEFEQLAEYFFGKIKAHNPKAKQANLKTWASQIQTFTKQTKYSIDDIKRVIDFIYSANGNRHIPYNLSPTSLRKNIDAIWVNSNFNKPEKQQYDKGSINTLMIEICELIGVSFTPETFASMLMRQKLNTIYNLISGTTNAKTDRADIYYIIYSHIAYHTAMVEFKSGMSKFLLAVDRYIFCLKRDNEMFENKEEILNDIVKLFKGHPICDNLKCHIDGYSDSCKIGFFINNDGNIINDRTMKALSTAEQDELMEFILKNQTKALTKFR